MGVDRGADSQRGMGRGRDIAGGSVCWWPGEREEAAGGRDRDQVEGGRDEGRGDRDNGKDKLGLRREGWAARSQGLRLGMDSGKEQAGV